ncbi:MAG: Gfo/Idh/MocA family oxidoreductase [Kiritimatiellae bacterium]|nr:Gfo/Idh/MocA family oxidoreductase [Kiritimatiellia bacterium]
MAKALVKDPAAIRLGVIGMTEGNGHPYSWSAILNGYDRKRMTKECPFPGIPAYLNAQPSEAFGLGGVKVTHVFCADRKDAEHVAALSRVPNVADTPGAMIGAVDAVLIATDIGGEHVARARPFVEAGLPVFIDKPLCDNAADLAVFEKWVADGAAILSSSSTRFAAEYAPYQYPNAPLGEWCFISMPMAKKWETYGIHALEAVYSITGPGYVSVRNTGTAERNIVHLKHGCGADVVIACGKGIVYGGALALCGSEGNATVVTKDTFSSFKAQLAEFAAYLKSGERPYPFSHTAELMRLVIGGIASRENNGQEVML